MSPEEAEKKTRYHVLGGCCSRLFFEYARPASYFAPLPADPLNSMMPLLLLLVTLFRARLAARNRIWPTRSAKWPFIFLGAVHGVDDCGRPSAATRSSSSERMLGYPVPVHHDRAHLYDSRAM